MAEKVFLCRQWKLSSLTWAFISGFKKGNGGTCNGDSGGPVFIADRNEDALCLYACVSFGAVEGCGIKQVDTRVSGYQKWIDDIISGIVPLQDAKNKNYPYCVPQKKT